MGRRGVSARTSGRLHAQDYDALYHAQKAPPPPGQAVVVVETRQQRRARQRALDKASKRLGMELVDSVDLAKEDDAKAP